MLKEKDIKSVKDKIPTSVSYQMIADASDGAASLSSIKRFYSMKPVPFEKGLKIIEATKKVIAAQAEKAKKVLAS